MSKLHKILQKNIYKIQGTFGMSCRKSLNIRKLQSENKTTKYDTIHPKNMFIYDWVLSLTNYGLCKLTQDINFFICNSYWLF